MTWFVLCVPLRFSAASALKNIDFGRQGGAVITK